MREATPKTVTALSLDDVKGYYAKTFRPDLTTMVVIGDVTADEAKMEIEKWFGNWKAAGAKPETNLPPVPDNKSSASNVPDPDLGAGFGESGGAVKCKSHQSGLLSAASGEFVLGGGFYATRLYHDLRQTAGYVYNVENQLSATQTRATYRVEYGCDPANVSKARTLILRDLVAMQTENVTQGSCSRPRPSCCARFLFRIERGGDAARLIRRSSWILPSG